MTIDLIEKVIAEYVAMYNGLLPEQVVAALSTLFGLDDDYVEMLDDALLEMVGQEVDDLQEKVLQAEGA